MEQFENQNQGYSQNAYQSYVSEYADYEFDPERNGFVTFWIWFMIIVNIGMVIYQFFANSVVDPWILRNLESAGLTDLVGKLQDIVALSNWATVIISVGAVVGLFMLLSWKRMGFWVVFAMAILTMIATLVVHYMLTDAFDGYLLFGGIDDGITAMMIFQPLIPVVILFAVLQIKKYGRSCWSDLV